MIIQLENVILISRNSETVLLLLLLLFDYFGARTNFALAYPSRAFWKQKKTEKLENPSRKSEIAPRQSKR